jgi:hypothetical protein
MSGIPNEIPLFQNGERRPAPRPWPWGCEDGLFSGSVGFSFIATPAAQKQSRSPVGRTHRNWPSFLSTVTAMPFVRKEQSPAMILGVLNFSSPALSFFAMNPRTFRASISALQPTVELETLAACAIAGKKSARIATNRCLFIKFLRLCPMADAGLL